MTSRPSAEVCRSVTLDDSGGSYGLVMIQAPRTGRVGGQLYGTMEGFLIGERIRGRLRLTNLAARRTDNVNLPTLRGLLTTEDEAAVWVELDGLATLRPEDNARVFVTSCGFRTGDQRYAWLNTIFGLLEGVLDRVAVGGAAHGQLFECRATIA